MLLAVFSIRPGVASRKTALPCVLLAHCSCRRSFPAPPERAFVQAPGVWFRDVAFLTWAVPGQFSSPANDAPRGLPSLSVDSNPPDGFFPSSRRRCPSLYHMRAKAIYPCRSTILLRIVGAAPRRRSRAAFPAAFQHVVAETAPALRGNIVSVRMTGKILGPAKSRLAVCSAARLRCPGLMRSFQGPVPWEDAMVATMMPNLRHARPRIRRLQAAPWRVRRLSQDGRWKG